VRTLVISNNERRALLAALKPGMAIVEMGDRPDRFTIAGLPDLQIVVGTPTHEDN
jgi:hypothetical protein